jgi:hypothetical protein
MTQSYFSIPSLLPEDLFYNANMAPARVEAPMRHAITTPEKERSLEAAEWESLVLEGELPLLEAVPLELEPPPDMRFRSPKGFPAPFFCSTVSVHIIWHHVMRSTYEVRLSRGWHIGKGVVSLPRALGIRRAAGIFEASLGSAVSGGVVGGTQLLLEGIEVAERLDVVTVDLNESVVVGLLGVFVDKTTGEDTAHLGAVESGNLSELTRRRLVATVLGEEHGDRVVGVVLHLCLPVGGGERRLTAPRVVVDSKEVTTSIRIVSTVEVGGHLETVLLNVGSTVTNRDGPEVARLDVLPHISGHGLDVGGRGSRGDVVDDLVGREKGQGVVIFGEDIDGSKDVLEVRRGVGGSRLGTVNGNGGRVDILTSY